MRKLICVIFAFSCVFSFSQNSTQNWNWFDGPISTDYGYAINFSAPLGHCLVGNGSYYVDSSTCGSGAINVVNATDYGVKANGRIITDATVANGSAIVTAPDANFTSADVGKVAWVTSMTTDISAMNSTVVIPRSTILSVNSATSITLSNIANTSLSAASTLVYGTLDSAPYNVTPTTVNDPLLAAWTVAYTTCEPLILPSGVMITEHGEFDTYDTTKPCSSTNNQLAQRAGYTFIGQGPTATIIAVSPVLPATDCTGPNGTGNGCFFSLPTVSMTNMQLYGVGWSNMGSAFNGKAIIYWPGLNVNGGTNYFLRNVNLFSLGANTAGLIGFQLGNGSLSNVSNAWWQNDIIEAFGSTGVNINARTGVIWWTDVTVNVNLTQNWSLNYGTLNSLNGQYGWIGRSSGNDVQVSAATFFNSNNDSWPYSDPGQNSNNALLSYGVSTLVNDTINETCTTCSSVVAINSAAVVRVANTVLGSGTGGYGLQAFSNGAKIIDVGGNSQTGTGTAFNCNSCGVGGLFGSASITGATSLATSFTLSTGWGSTAAISGVTGSNSVLFTITNSGTGQAANPTITYTFPTPYWQPPSWCTATQVGGTNPTLVFAAGTPTNNNVLITAAGTPTASDTEIMQIYCVSR